MYLFKKILKLILVINISTIAVIFGISYLLFGPRYTHLYFLMLLLGCLHTMAVMLLWYKSWYLYERVIKKQLRHIPIKLQPLIPWVGVIITGLLLFWIDVIILKYFPLFHLPRIQYTLIEPFVISVLNVISVVVGMVVWGYRNFNITML